MRRLIFSYATDSHQALLQYSRPTYEHYGNMFGYDVKIFGPDDVDLNGMTPHWAKLKLFQTVLAEYDTAIWIDADAMFVRFDTDIEGGLLGDDFQGLVLEQFPERWNPNTGVWLMRSNDQSHQFINEILERGIVAPYWADQAGVMHALGWQMGTYPRGIRLVNPSPYLQNTCWLSPEWNVLSPSPDLRWSTHVKHFAGGPASAQQTRLDLMKAEYEKLNSWPNRLPWTEATAVDYHQQ